VKDKVPVSIVRALSLCLAFGSTALIVGCSSRNDAPDVGPYSKEWVVQQIQAYESPTPEAASRVTHKFSYAGKPAYLIPSPCCDRYDYLYDSRGAILCAPSGGFTGHGDGSCTKGLRTPSGG